MTNLERDDSYELELWFGWAIDIPGWLGDLWIEVMEPSWAVRIFWGTLFLLWGFVAFIFGMYLAYA